MKEDITCVFEGVAGVGGIYISNIKAAQNIELLNSLGIKAIVTVVRNGMVQHHKSEINDHLYIPADDVESYDLSKHFQQTYLFIDNVRKKTNVLVHCHAGISRSATIVIAYLLKKYNYSLDKVISMVKRRRTKINPNKGFIQQLKNEALKMGITPKQNISQLQEIFKKPSSSVQKSRFLTSYSAKKQQIMRQKISPAKNRIIKFQLEKANSSCLEKRSSSLALSKADQKYAIEQNNLQIDNVRLNLQSIKKLKSKILENASQKYDKYLKIPDQKTEKPRSPTGSLNGQVSTQLAQKFQKIQKLRSKVLESQKKKQQSQKSPLSKPQGPQNSLKPNPQEQLLKTASVSAPKPDLPVQSQKQPSNSHINKVFFANNSTLF